MQWEQADGNLLAFARELAVIRRGNAAFADGDFIPVCAHEALFAFLRRTQRACVLVVLNRSERRRALKVPNVGEVTLEPWQTVIKSCPNRDEHSIEES